MKSNEIAGEDAASGATERRTRVDPRRERTRARLIEAATELVHRGGLKEATVSEIARRAGVKQSLFYYHFNSVDECLADAGRQIVERLAPLDRALRRDMLWSNSVTDENVQFYKGALDRWLAAGPLVELLIAHRLDGSAFARALQPQVDSLRDELTIEIWNDLSRLGASAEHIHEVRLAADQLASSWYWALEVVSRGRTHDRTLVARRLAESGLGTLAIMYQRILGEDAFKITARRLDPVEK